MVLASQIEANETPGHESHVTRMNIRTVCAMFYMTLLGIFNRKVDTKEPLEHLDKCTLCPLSPMATCLSCLVNVAKSIHLSSEW